MKQETNSYNLIFNEFTSSLFPSNSEKEKLPSNNNFNLYQKDSFAVKLTYVSLSLEIHAFWNENKNQNLLWNQYMFPFLLRFMHSKMENGPTFTVKSA